MIKGKARARGRAHRFRLHRHAESRALSRRRSWRSKHGFHVLSDKPATFDLAEAKELAALVKKTGLLYGLTHNYTGYPLVKEARELVAAGKLGKIRKVVVEYPQGWLATRIEASGQKQAAWRTDPKRSGAAGCIGDIGTHAENLAEYITGLKISELAADLTAFVEGPHSSMTTATSCSASRAARKACCTARRFPSAKRTTSTSASMAKKAASNGTRTSRTPCW